MHIAMLISGGVDSSVSLRLLQEQGHDITAFYLKIWLEDEMAFLGECPWEEDLKHVRAVCEEAGVPLHIVPFQKEYWERVVAYTLAEVKAGRTPNPDMLCNPQIKFGAFYDAFGKEYDKIATGHYAQNGIKDGITYLKRSPDPIKDQTYFLSQLSQAQVARSMFPIGHLRKSEVRALAKKFKLPNAERKDSQGICFLGNIEFDTFLEYHLGKKQGDIVEHETGKKLGEHDGFWYYTIGQRRNIRLSGGPWYVVAKDPEKNSIAISNHWRGDKARDTFEVGDVNWISESKNRKRRTKNRKQETCLQERGCTPVRTFKNTRSRVKPCSCTADRSLTVKIRHGEKEYPCHLHFLKNGNVKVKLDDADSGIAPGQFAVFYDGVYCLGGGVIV